MTIANFFGFCLTTAATALATATGCIGSRAMSLSAAECIVERVIDGDTLTCEDGERVRLLLIDTPEMDQGDFGRRARRYLLELAPPGTALRLERDVQMQDRYGRTLAYLYTPDGRMLNEEMARAGFAVALVYPPNVRYVERIRKAVKAAREAGLGLWATSAFECAPVDHRTGRCGGNERGGPEARRGSWGS
ncbi:MAG TPA: thermonuclease family protein [Longimicrobiaceae bacterium]